MSFTSLISSIIKYLDRHKLVEKEEQLVKCMRKNSLNREKKYQGIRED